MKELLHFNARKRNNMEAPDKIYRHRTTGNLRLNGAYYGYNPPKIRYNDIITEYIRKDILLEYLRREYALVDFHLKAQDDPVWWGQRNAFQQVIDKIESL